MRLIKIKKIGFLSIFCLFIINYTLGQTSVSQEERLNSIISKLEQKSGGIIGVGALYLETGKSYFYNKDIRYPMASAIKIPVTVQLLYTVDKGEFHYLI